MSIYLNRQSGNFWVTGEDIWSSRTYIYNKDGEYLDYDDCGDNLPEECEYLDCKTLKEAVALVYGHKQHTAQITEAKELLKILEAEKTKLQQALRNTEQDIITLKAQITEENQNTTSQYIQENNHYGNHTQ